MTRKDYEALASIIRMTTVAGAVQDMGGMKVLGRNDFVLELCAYLKRDNSNFDTDRFLEAVEPNYKKSRRLD